MADGANASADGQRLRIGTRGSKLARWQADWVAERLRRRDHTVEIIEIASRGDTEVTAAIGEIGTVGVFTKEIQQALLAGDVDLAVHSLKDLPTEVPVGLHLAAVPPRESVADALVVRAGSREQGAGSKDSGSLPLAPFPLLRSGARVGTGSPRRQAQLRHARPDLQVEGIRGNVDTRLRKLDEGRFEAIVLAEAGLRRLGLGRRISEVLPLEAMLPAVGQGALAIECRAEDEPTHSVVAPLDDSVTRAAVTAERAMLLHLRGGCLAPVGAWGRIEGRSLQLAAVVLSADGKERIDAHDDGSPDEAESLGRAVAESLLARGAGELIAAARGG